MKENEWILDYNYRGKKVKNYFLLGLRPIQIRWIVRNGEKILQQKLEVGVEIENEEKYQTDYLWYDVQIEKE